MLSRSDVEKLWEGVLRAIEKYNAYHSPEARASIVSMEDGRILVRIRGSFTETCGINDWIEDLVYAMRDEGIRVHLESIIEPEDPLDLGEERIAVIRIEALDELGVPEAHRAHEEGLEC